MALLSQRIRLWGWSPLHAAVAFAGLMVCLCCLRVGIAADDRAAAEKRIGRSIHITLPITGQTVDHVEQFVRRAIEKVREEGGRPVLIFEFEILPNQAESARLSDFGAALSLAEFLTSDELNGVRTVAYVPQSIRGHAVLVVLACDEIIMAKEAAIGPASGEHEVITEAHRGNYRDLANRRKTVPAEVALWLLDPSRQVLVVETELSRDYIAAADLQKWQKDHTVKTARKLYDADNPAQSVVQVSGQLGGEEARRLDFAGYLVAGRQDVAKALDLPPESVEVDPSLVGGWRAVQVNLEGPITADRVSQVERMIEDAVRTRDVNFVCLWIHSQGGSLADSIRLANFLHSPQLSHVRTVAYVPVQARSDAALVALACRQLVMHPRAELGGPGPHEFNKEEVAYARDAIRDERGPWNSRSWSLPAAMIDRHLVVYRCTRLPNANEVDYLSQEELDDYQQKHPDAKKWQKGAQVTIPDQQLLVGGQRAVEYHLASRTVDDFAAFRRYYGLEDDPALLEPGWAHYLIEALASPGVAAFLLMVGFVALYIELHSPGIGIGGFVAAVCFVLFFWSHYLAGKPEWLEILLFLAGLCCLLLEFFVLPGYAIFGLGGGILVLISLILTSQTTREWPQNPYQFAELQRSLLTIAGAGAGFVVVAVLLRKWLPHAPVLSQVFLAPPSEEEAQTISRREALVDLHDLHGARGVATTQLTPSGKARFGSRLVDVITDGDVIRRGTNIEVVEIIGNRVVVRAVE